MFDRSSGGRRARALRPARIPLTLLLALALAGPAGAQGVPGVDANKCLAGKNKCVAKKLAGLMKCREKCENKPDKCGQAQSDCEATVMAKFDGGANPAKSCFAKLEAKADPAKPKSVCTTTGDTATMEALVDTAVGDLVEVLEGAVPAAWTCDPAFYGEGPAFLCNCGCGAPDSDCGGLTVGACDSCDDPGGCAAAADCSQIDPSDNSRCRPYQCGNGAIESPESCDGTDLGGATCASLGFGSGTLACTAGCGFDVSGCSLCFAGVRFVDRGLTVLDCDTGLEWEKKTAGNVNATYTWSASGTAPDGTAFTTFLPAVAAALGGTVCASPYDCTSADGVTVSCTTPPPDGCWRLPEIDELQTILDCGHSPCIDPIFGPTAPSVYWSATSNSGSPGDVWGMFFVGGLVGDGGKVFGFQVRAVRGGS